MIKVEDLRVGDLVYVNRSNILPYETVCTIVGTRAGTNYVVECVILILTKQDWRLGTWDCNDIDGIPLDSHILEKNGFNNIIPKKKFTKSLGYTSKFLKRCLVIELAQNGYKVSLKHEGMSDKITIRHIQYVHELQHILLAFGMDADLKIPEKSDGKEAKPLLPLHWLLFISCRVLYFSSSLKMICWRNQINRKRRQKNNQRKTIIKKQIKR